MSSGVSPSNPACQSQQCVKQGQGVTVKFCDEEYGRMQEKLDLKNKRIEPPFRCLSDVLHRETTIPLIGLVLLSKQKKTSFHRLKL